MALGASDGEIELGAEGVGRQPQPPPRDQQQCTGGGEERPHHRSPAGQPAPQTCVPETAGKIGGRPDHQG